MVHLIFNPQTISLAETLIGLCRARGFKIATVESCTGGLIAGTITSVSGASDIFEYGLVTYANEAKTKLVGVPSGLFLGVGAVSYDVARAMAEGAVARYPVEAAVAVTGIAGPGGGSPDKPVGLVHIAAARRAHATITDCHVFPGDREAVRSATIDAALKLLTDLVAR